MAIFVDLTEFFAAPHRTGIQRVCGELCRAWPLSGSLKAVKLKNNALVQMREDTLELIHEYFQASGNQIRLAEERLKATSLEAESHGQTIDLNENHKILVPEVFYDPTRVRFFRELPKEQLRRFYFIAFDFLPFTNPEFFPGDQPHEIVNGYTRILRRSPNVAFISQSTRETYWRRLLRCVSVSGPVLRLGSDGLGIRARSVPTRTPFPTFAVVGTIEPRKNHAIILDAFETALRDRKELHLIFAGRMGWIDSWLEEKIRTAARSSWFEHCSNPNDKIVREMVERSWATIYVSSAEGFGLPPVESLWLGTPVIASSTVPSLEAIGSRGVHYVQPLNVACLTRAILMMSNRSYSDEKSRESLSLDLPTWRSFTDEVADWLRA